ncbi:TPM domain-containing protein [Xanthobacter sp. TB0139]|uniref:TPM domain-containing protein n=1 Tax=Xanthobacter sp. TB0139 TaxID=3459178 RepID=UPI0040399E0B
MTSVGTTSPDMGGGELGLAPENLNRIATAISEAEEKTAAEIRVVISKAPIVQHSFFPLMWAGFVALVLPWGALLFWSFSALAILEVQAIIFMVLAGILLLPRFSDKVVPRLALKAAVRSSAIEKFLSYGMVETAGRTGVLIFVAAHEHMVEVVADEGVHNRLGATAWAEICALIARQARHGHLADGLVAGVERAGDMLSQVVPRQPGDTNEIENRVIIL